MQFNLYLPFLLERETPLKFYHKNKGSSSDLDTGTESLRNKTLQAQAGRRLWVEKSAGIRNSLSSVQLSRKLLGIDNDARRAKNQSREPY